MFLQKFRRQSPHSLRPTRLGFERLEPRIALDASMLRITEFVASNDNGLKDYDGDSSDWLEVFNTGNDAVNLEGLHLTDKSDNLSKWTFPTGTSLEGGGYLVVFASSKDIVQPNGELHTNFALSAGGEYLGLVDSDGTTILDEYSPEFPSQLEDVSYGVAMNSTGTSSTLIATGASGKAWVPTSSVYDATWKNVGFDDTPFNITGPTGFGYENRPGDPVNFNDEIGTTVPSGTGSLYVRVPFTVNSLTGIDRLTLRMRYDDGFVAYLNGVKLDAEALAPDVPQWDSLSTGNHDDPLADQFEDFDISTAITHLQVGQNVLALHAMNTSPTSSDFLISPELVATDTGIITPISRGYFEMPTPGYGNGETNFDGFLEQPTFSLDHGFYDSPQSVSIGNIAPGAIAVYTTDGSTPAVNQNMTVSNGTLYSGPISISSTTTLRAMVFQSGYDPSLINSSSYLFLNDIINQSPSGQTPPGFAPNGVNGQEINYGIDPDIIGLYGAQAVKNSLEAIPSISITTDLANLFDSNTGIYVNANNRGKPWERPSTVELINPSGEDGFTVNAGLRIRGGYSRNDYNPKHAFRLYFRGEYGETKLNYPLFEEEGAEKFDVLDIRTAQNYSWSGDGNNQNSFVREVFARDIQRDLEQPYTRSRYYHLYLDGVYWGLFQTQERVEKYYGETYLGGEETDYDVVKSGLGDVGGTEVADGNDQAWRQLFDLGQSLASNPQANSNAYWTMQGLNPDGTRNPSLPVLLDVDNLISYMSIIFYTGGYDTGLSSFINNNKANNWVGMYNRTEADEGFQFFIHDNEHSMGAGWPDHSTVYEDRTGPFNNGNQNNFAQFNPQYLHQDLLVHPEYRQKFIDFVQKEFFNSGAFTLTESQVRLLERIAQVNPAIIAESARWGDSKVQTPKNKSTWQNEINWLLNSYLPIRGGIVLDQLENDGLFTDFSAPSFNQHGGEVSSGFQLTMSASAGTIYYTTDGVTDPRLIGGGINSNPAVKTFSGPITLSADTTVMARLRRSSGEWSGLVEATFDVPSQTGDFNGDSTVDGSDFLAWQRSFGATVSPAGSGADGNGDGTVNGPDLAHWQNNYGTSTPVSASVAIDETPQAGVYWIDDLAIEPVSVGNDLDSAPRDVAFGAVGDETSPQALPLSGAHTEDQSTATLFLDDEAENEEYSLAADDYFTELAGLGSVL